MTDHTHAHRWVQLSLVSSQMVCRDEASQLTLSLSFMLCLYKHWHGITNDKQRLAPGKKTLDTLSLRISIGYKPHPQCSTTFLYLFSSDFLSASYLHFLFSIFFTLYNSLLLPLWKQGNMFEQEARRFCSFDKAAQCSPGSSWLWRRVPTITVMLRRVGTAACSLGTNLVFLTHKWSPPVQLRKWNVASVQ